MTNIFNFVWDHAICMPASAEHLIELIIYTEILMSEKSVNFFPTDSTYICVVRMVVRSTRHQTAWELLGTDDSKLVRRVERKPLIIRLNAAKMYGKFIIAAFQRNHSAPSSSALVKMKYIYVILLMYIVCM